MKPSKPLWKLSVATTLDAEDAVGELLGGLCGGNASSYFDVEAQTSVVSVYVSQKKFLSPRFRRHISDGLRRIAQCGLGTGPGKIKAGRVRRQDWAESWKRHFKPMAIGASLLVKPSWSKQRPRPGQATVVLDPGLSFGTGQHPTTSFCLRELARCRRGGKPQSLLDLGTGSGILAIAAAKLGYRPVRAIDFDVAAVRIAKANARANGIKAKIERGDVTVLPAEPRERYDFICANLISNLLVAEAEKIIAQLNGDGVLVLAGILKTEFSHVQNAFEALGLELVSAKTEKEWRSGSFRFA